MYETFCLDLKEHATKIINYEKEETIPLTKEEKKMYREQRLCYIRKGFSTNDNNKKYHKVKDHCYYTGKYRGAAHNICSLRYKTPKKNPLVFHNGSTYDYHFIVEDLVEEFEGLFKCLGENTEKYIKLFQSQLKKNLTMVNQLHTK